MEWKHQIKSKDSSSHHYEIILKIKTYLNNLLFFSHIIASTLKRETLGKALSFSTSQFTGSKWKSMIFQFLDNLNDKSYLKE